MTQERQSSEVECRGGELLRVLADRVGSTAVVRLSGELDMATGWIATKALKDASVDVTALVVVLDGLAFCGSTGLTMLVEWQRRADERGFELRVVATCRRVLRPIRIAGLDGLLAMHASVEDALAAEPRRYG